MEVEAVSVLGNKRVNSVSLKILFTSKQCLLPADRQDQAVRLQIKLFSPLATTDQLSYSDSSQSLS